MFKSSLTSSITGWFSSINSENQEEKTSENPKQKDEEKNDQIPNAEAEENSPEESQAGKDGDQAKTSTEKPTTDDVQAKLSLETQKMMNSAVSFGNYLFGVASEASKKMSERVTETATTIKKTVEEKSIIGDLNREQEEFLQKKKERQVVDSSVPPWVGYQECESMKQQILALSTDKRNFLRNPPSGVKFNFDFDHHYPMALVTLEEDENLRKMRFELVPKNLKEEVFWRNYFYRVSLIKQSAQLSTLAEMTRSGSEQPSSSASSTSSAVIIGSTNTGTISRSSSSKSLKSDSDNNSSSPKRECMDQLETADIDTGVGPEFASDDFDSSGLNPHDLERDMKQLGMGEGNEGVPEWEKQLQLELQDYEVVTGAKEDENWEKEIEQMLSVEVAKQ